MELCGAESVPISLCRKNTTVPAFAVAFFGMNFGQQVMAMSIEPGGGASVISYSVTSFGAALTVGSGLAVGDGALTVGLVPAEQAVRTIAQTTNARTGTPSA